jgi:DNA-binding protein HU-beta
LTLKTGDDHPLVRLNSRRTNRLLIHPFLLEWARRCRYPLRIIMAKALTKSQIAASVAETVGLTKKQAVETIEALVALAYKNAKNSFTIPGLGKLVLVKRKARMGRNPATGAAIKIPAKRVVKFRVAKAAKDAILGTK